MARGEPAMKNARTGGRKLGEVLAERIENEIIERGWPVGEVLGSEADLIDKYDVSRAVFREAMRIVDHHGVAEMRRGPGGGLVVAAPDLDAATRTVALHLEYLRIEPQQINEARLALELAVVRAATDRLTPEGAERIKQHLDHEQEDIKRTRELGRARGDLPTHDFHLLLADLTGNPAMRLFVQIVAQVTGSLSPRSESLEETAVEVHRTHQRIADAILTGDADAAERRMRRHLETVVHYLMAGDGSRAPARARRGSRT
jgi:DNA-binding FadR family transcriptional regulator